MVLAFPPCPYLRKSRDPLLNSAYIYLFFFSAGTVTSRAFWLAFSAFMSGHIFSYLWPRSHIFLSLITVTYQHILCFYENSQNSQKYLKTNFKVLPKFSEDFRRFPKISEYFPKIFKTYKINQKPIWKYFRKFAKIFEHCRRFPKIFRRFLKVRKKINKLFTGLSLRPRSAYSRPRSQFLPIRTSQPVNIIYVLLFLWN